MNPCKFRQAVKRRYFNFPAMQIRGVIEEKDMIFYWRFFFFLVVYLFIALTESIQPTSSSSEYVPSSVTQGMELC